LTNIIDFNVSKIEETASAEETTNTTLDASSSTEDAAAGATNYRSFVFLMARDDKVLAVPTGDPRYAEYHDLGDLPEHILKEIAYLFETHKVLEGKQVKVLGWEGAEAAKQVIVHCQDLYRQNTRRQPRIRKRL